MMESFTVDVRKLKFSQVFEMDNEIEKYVQLTMKQRLRILSEQVTTLVRNHSGHQPLMLNQLPDAFRIHYGFALRPEQYDAGSLDELVAKLRNQVQVYTLFIVSQFKVQVEMQLKLTLYLTHCVAVCIPIGVRLFWEAMGKRLNIQ